jgi:heme/copper-type cytochrome/quinol oxidase subunit 2
MGLSSNLLVIGLIAVAAISFVNQSFAQSTSTPTYARVEIWALFYRLMVIAFVVGALVLGVIGYIVWRFRESHPKNRIPTREPLEGGHH